MSEEELAPVTDRRRAVVVALGAGGLLLVLGAMVADVLRPGLAPVLMTVASGSTILALVVLLWIVMGQPRRQDPARRRQGGIAAVCGVVLLLAQGVLAVQTHLDVRGAGTAVLAALILALGLVVWHRAAG